MLEYFIICNETSQNVTNIFFLFVCHKDSISLAGVIVFFAHFNQMWGEFLMSFVSLIGTSLTEFLNFKDRKCLSWNLVTASVEE
jgi:hypothetical protein